MSNVDLDVALAEFSALRAEILSCQQAQTGMFAAGITATAAIGTIALSKGGRREILLVLPFVLSGLGLLYLDYVRRPATIGEYIRTELWKVLENRCGDLPCWETYLHEMRDTPRHRPRHRVLSVLPFLLVFLVPTVAVLFLAVAIHRGWSSGLWDFWVPWTLGVLFALMLMWRTRYRHWYPAVWD